MGNVTSNIDYKLANIIQDPTGFVDNTLITTTYDATTRQVTITSSSGVIEIIEKRKLYSYASPIVSSAHANGVGVFNYYLTFSNGAFSWGTSVWNFNMIMVAKIVWNSTQTPAGFMLKETHGLMPWTDHEESHLGLGTLLTSGGTLSGYALSSTVDVDQQFTVDTTTIKDEDLSHTLSVLTGAGANTYTILRRVNAPSNGSWGWTTANTVPYLRAGAALPVQRNYDTGGGVWGLEAATSNTNRVNYYVLAVPNGNAGLFRFIIIPGQVFYTSSATALAETFDQLQLGTLADDLVEYFLFARVTIKRNSATNNIIETVTLLRGNRTSTIGSSAIPTNHQTLSGRSALNQHPTTAIFAASADKVVVSQNDGSGGFNLIESTTTTSELATLNTNIAKAYFVANFDNTGAPRYDGTDAIILAKGTTVQRNAPAIATPIVGMIRFNSDLEVHESYRASGWAQVGERWASGTLLVGGTTVFTPPSLTGATCTGFSLMLKIDNGVNNQKLSIEGNLDGATWKASVVSVSDAVLTPTITVNDATGAVAVVGISGTYKWRVNGFIY